MMRETAAYYVDWDSRFEILPWTEEKTEEIGKFLFENGHKSDLQECKEESLEASIWYVTRAIKYYKQHPPYESGFAASSLVYDKETGELVAVCLLGSGPKCSGVYDIFVAPGYRRQGIARNMLKRALTVLAEKGVDRLDLWRHDESPGSSLYDELGFKPTGEAE
jgi:GNAT superfamily N-acetyltransferase